MYMTSPQSVLSGYHGGPDSPRIVLDCQNVTMSTELRIKGCKTVYIHSQVCEVYPNIYGAYHSRPLFKGEPENQGESLPATVSMTLVVRNHSLPGGTTCKPS
jgi:hypothetical protein